MNLITIDQYKDYKNITSTTDDTVINSLIPAMSMLVKNYCGRTFIDYYNTNKTEYWSEGGSKIFLSEFPIQTIVSVKESGDNFVDDITDWVVDEDYYLDAERGFITTANGTDVKVSFNRIQVIYKGGYVETPADLKLAIFHLVDYFRKEQFTQRKTLGVHTVEQNISDKMPGHIKRTLDAYKGNSW